MNRRNLILSLLSAIGSMLVAVFGVPRKVFGGESKSRRLNPFRIEQPESRVPRCKFEYFWAKTGKSIPAELVTPIHKEGQSFAAFKVRSPIGICEVTVPRENVVFQVTVDGSGNSIDINFLPLNS